jgi:predicted GIY-YIG superfamily endonuclease
MKKYIVYKIMFKEQMAVYVGCTNNLKQRLSQHKECRTNTRIYNFIKKNNLINEIELIPIHSFDDRKEALNFEKKFIYRISTMTLYNILNESWIKGCKFPASGLSGGLSKSSKEWVVLNLKTKEVIDVISLRDFGFKNNLNYKDLHACALGKINVSQGYKCFKKSDWDSFTQEQKDYYASDKLFNDLKKIKADKLFNSNAKEYVIITPNQEIIRTKGLDRYAELMGLNKGNLSATAMPKHYGKYCKGYRAFRIEDWNNFTQQEISNILSESKTYRIAGKSKRKDVGNQQPSHSNMEGSTTIENMLDESQVEVSRVGHKLLVSEAVGIRKYDDIV